MFNNVFFEKRSVLEMQMISETHGEENDMEKLERHSKDKNSKYFGLVDNLKEYVKETRGYYKDFMKVNEECSCKEN